MSWLLFLLLASPNSKSVEVRHTDVAPRIDGIIDSVW
jgi:hypothetical protein